MLAVSIGLYLLFTIAIGAWASRKVNSANDFMLAGQQLPLFLSTSALFATWFGSETIFGASSEYLEHGLLGVIEDPFGGALCLVLFGLFYVKPIYRMRVSTLGDVYVRLFGKKIGFIASLCMVPAFFGYTAAQLVALSLILGAVTGVTLIPGILISVAIVVLYTFLGGMWAISITDFIQTLVIIVGLIWVTVVILEEAGGVSDILAEAPPESFKFFPAPDFSSWGSYFGAWAILGLGSIPSQDIYQRVMASKSERVARRSLYLAAGCYLTFGLLPLLIALGAKTLYPDIYLENPQMLLPQMVLQHTGLGVQIIFFGALLSAIMSTTSSSLLAPAAILSENIFRQFLRPYSDRKMLWLLRLNVMAVAIVAVFMATWKANIYELVADASILLLVSLFVPLTAGLYWKKASKPGAVLSIFLGMGSYFILDQFTFAIPSFLLATAFSALGMAVGTYIKPKNPKCNPIIR
ncbi:sodium:solute symporter family protein [Lunatimonas salinarum]|uniref:sodium:solute symporter family protein n=1 Tax=Lunatimonas salinarum TaxID=1774590 RepID=UPI001ADEE6AC|nr:sodium:solute symporter family protein [Lunatimonas salinarum]